MKIKELFTAYTKDSFRQFETVFWAIVFPSLFFIFFVSIFENAFNQENDFNLKAGIYYEKPLTGINKMTFESVFNAEGIPFHFSEYTDEEKGIEDVKKKDIDIFIVFPENFDKLNLKNFDRLNLKFISDKLNVNIDNLQIYTNYTTDSQYAYKIFKSITDEINIAIKNKGELKENFRLEYIGTQEKEFRYRDYLFPSILLMGILTISFFNIPIGMAENIEKGIIKRFSVTPLRGSDFFMGFMLSNLLVVVLSIIVLYFEGYLLKIEPVVYSFKFLSFLFYSIIVCVSFGLLIASFFKKINTAAVFGQIAYQMTIFLSGFYFDTKATPWIIRWYVYFNPVTYMVDGMRNIINGNSVGLQNLIVPAIWLVVSLTVFSFSFKRVMHYEK